jgi:hypothetical protein
MAATPYDDGQVAALTSSLDREQPVGDAVSVDLLDQRHADLLGDASRRLVPDADEAHDPVDAELVEGEVSNRGRGLCGQTPTPVIAP